MFFISRLSCPCCCAAGANSCCTASSSCQEQQRPMTMRRGNRRKNIKKKAATSSSTYLAVLCVLVLISGSVPIASSFVVSPSRTTTTTTKNLLAVQNNNSNNNNNNREKARTDSTSTTLYTGFFQDKKESLAEDGVLSGTSSSGSASTTTSTTQNKSKDKSPAGLLAIINTTPGNSILTNNDNSSNNNNNDSSVGELRTQLNAYTEDIQGVLDDYTGGWALSYADLTPDSPDTAAGKAFLATNLFYAAAGGLLTFSTGDAFLGLLTDLAAICSYNYHYQQLQSCAVEDHAKDQMQSLVRLSLLLDYAVAGATILTAFGYLLSSEVTSLEHHLANAFGGDIAFALEIGLVGVVFLALSWKYEKGRPYMFYHSMWHLFSAYAGYLIGTAHFNVEAMAATTTASPLLDAIAGALGWS